jgi:hypothetical protein
MKICSLLNELSPGVMKSYRDKAIPDAMQKHKEGKEVDAVKRAKSVSRSVRLDLKQRGKRELWEGIKEQITAEGYPEAASAYSSRAEQVQTLLREISELIAQHQVKQQANSKNWGFAGDLAHVAEQLEQIKEFLASGEQVAEAVQSTFARRVEDYINQNFYVFNDRVSGDDRIDYIIEESKAKYEIYAANPNVVMVAPDLGTGATRPRAKEIKRELLALASVSESFIDTDAVFSPTFVRGVYDGSIDLQDAMASNSPEGRAVSRLYDEVVGTRHLDPEADADEILQIISDEITRTYGD